MRVPLKWLGEMVALPPDPEALAARLTLAGLEVTRIETVGGDWAGVVVGKVLRVEPHPNADRLRLVTVDPGGAPQRVVCGAPNVAPGQRIAFAAEGAMLRDPRTGAERKLKKSRIRGVVSAGMVCSEAELGLSEEHAGILVLDTDRAPGTPLAEVLGDRVFVFDLTPNRADALSVLGVAREVAAFTDARLRQPETEAPRVGAPIAGRADAEIADPDLCPRFTLALIEAVEPGPSPKWMQERLVAAGMRPISNLVDITNYVMLELGQPVHAFDYDRVRDHRIIVRRAAAGETLTTLDGQRRELDPQRLVIADPGGPIALAGVMGGAATEITSHTRNVLLEVANFDPVTVRRTARRYDLFSDAARRFAWGLPPALAPVASSRVCRLFAEHAGGRVAAGMVDVWPRRERPVRILLRHARVGQVLGIPVRPETAGAALERLGFDVAPAGADAFDVGVPGWRRDMRVPDDLVEEVGRFLGYDDLPAHPISGAIPHHPPLPARDLRERVRDLAAAAGLQEVQTYTLLAGADLEPFSPRDDDARPAPLRIRNPLGRARDTLRTSLRPGILGVAARNLGRGEPSVALFEVGRVYLPRARRDADLEVGVPEGRVHLPGDGGEGRLCLPREEERAVGCVSGVRLDRFGSPTDAPLDFFDARATLEGVITGLGLDVSFRPGEEPGFVAGRVAVLRMRGRGTETRVGILGQLHPETAERFGLDGDAFLWELDLSRLSDQAGGLTAPREVRPLPRYPAAAEDFAFVVRGETAAGDLLEAVSRHPLVESARVFDDFPLGGRAGHPPGSRSVGVRVRYRAPNRTLRERDIAKVRKGVLKRARTSCGAEVRRDG